MPRFAQALKAGGASASSLKRRLQETTTFASGGYDGYGYAGSVTDTIPAP